MNLQTEGVPGESRGLLISQLCGGLDSASHHGCAAQRMLAASGASWKPHRDRAPGNPEMSEQNSSK